MTEESPDQKPAYLGKANQCTAHNQRGARCGKHAEAGMTVCRMHGGAAPQTKRKAALRLLALVDPAIATLAKEMTNKDATPGERLRAVENVLDRAGYPRKNTMSVEDARDTLTERLQEIRRRRAEEEFEALEPEEDPSDA